MDTINFIISLFVWISLSAKQIHTAATEAAKRQKYNDLLYNHHFQPVQSRPLVCMISPQPFFSAASQSIFSDKCCHSVIINKY